MPLRRADTIGRERRPPPAGGAEPGKATTPFSVPNTQYFKILRGFDLSLQRYAAIVVESE
jgi:hypothetical protein